MDELELPGRHRGHVDPLRRLAEDRPFVLRLALGGAIELDVQLLARDELAVADALRAIAANGDGAVGRREPIDRDAEARRSQLQQRFARGRGGEREVALVEIRRRRLAARRRALIGRNLRVAHDERHAIERHRQLLGDELRLRGQDALSDLAFAGICRHAAVSRDRDP